MKSALAGLILRYVLVPLAVQIYRKYRPMVVAITGSVGKTTTKETVYAVLSQYFDVAKTPDAANTAWSITATLISPYFALFAQNRDGKSVMYPQYMLMAVLVGLWRFFLPTRYPRTLVLELGVDRPGDMEFFNGLMQYDIAVVTKVGGAHLENFGDYPRLFAEKTAIYKGLKPTGLAIFNADQEDLATHVGTLAQRKVGFGEGRGAEVSWKNEKIVDGVMTAEFKLQDDSLVAKLPVGRQWLPATAVACAVGQEYALSGEQIAAALAKLHQFHGRFEVYTLNRGIKLIDDAYNANLDSMRMAIESLQDVTARKRIAVLGDMKELGVATESAHRELGRLVAGKVNHLFTVGSLAGLIGESAIAAGMEPGRVTMWRDLSDQAVDGAVSAIMKEIGDNDAVLVKGSRAMRLDRVVSAIIQKLSQ